VATIALGVFFPTAIAVHAAVDGVPRNLVRMAQSFGVPARDILRKVVLPGAWPAILAGFRITASIALILVVSAEMIGAQQGIGQFVLQAGNLMIPEDLLAGILVLSLLGLAIGALIGAVERRTTRWR
jgi:NitT/TauT family transport system permease protein